VDIPLPDGNLIIVPDDEVCNLLHGKPVPVLSNARGAMPGRIVWIATLDGHVTVVRYRALIVRIVSLIVRGTAYLSIEADPIEDDLPRGPRDRWLVGRHFTGSVEDGSQRGTGWYSITIPPDPRIYCIRAENFAPAMERFPDEQPRKEGRKWTDSRKSNKEFLQRLAARLAGIC
jgi:hypothetical protein